MSMRLCYGRVRDVMRKSGTRAPKGQIVFRSGWTGAGRCSCGVLSGVVVFVVAVLSRTMCLEESLHNDSNQEQE